MPCKLWCPLNVPQVFTRCAGFNNILSNVVDIFDVRSGAWTTAALSVARSFLAATSLPNDGVAMFAGGWGAFFSVHFLIAERVQFAIIGSILHRFF